jgi:hypothetical protein
MPHYNWEQRLAKKIGPTQTLREFNIGDLKVFLVTPVLVPIPA